MKRGKRPRNDDRMSEKNSQKISIPRVFLLSSLRLSPLPVTNEGLGWDPLLKMLCNPGGDNPSHLLQQKSQVPEPLKPPSYIFDASVLRRRRDVVKRATCLSTAFMERHCSHVRVPQFGVGFRGAGAPMHTHHAALNASFAGRVFWVGCCCCLFKGAHK